MTDIDGVSGAGGPVMPRKPEQSQEQVEPVAKTAAPPERSDVVSFTPTAEALAQLHEDMRSGAPIDRQKVEAIKQALAAGEYQLDAERIARKFVEIEEALGKL